MHWALRNISVKKTKFLVLMELSWYRGWTDNKQRTKQNVNDSVCLKAISSIEK